MGSESVTSISTIKIGDKVLTHKGNFKPVTSIHEYEKDEELYKIKVYGGVEIFGTWNHSIFVYDEKRGKIREKLLKDLTENDYLVFPRNEKVEENLEEDSDFSIITDDYIFRKIRKIEKEHYKGKVYDLTVEDDESYNVMGCAVHNSTLYQYIRYFDTFHPLVGNTLDLHTQLPLSRFALKKVKDPEILHFYEEMLEQMSALTLIYDQLREYWRIGEVFTYLYWDEDMGAWTDGAIFQPEYIDVLGSPILGINSDYIYKLRFDESIREIFEESQEEGEDLTAHIPQEMLEAMESGEAITLDNYNMMPIARKSPYSPRGESVVLRCLMDLIQETRLKEALMAVAERHIAPKEIWKVGSENFMPTQEYLNAVTDLILNSTQQPDFKLVTTHVVNYEIVGATGKFPNIYQDLESIEKRIMTGMFTNKSFTHGEGPTYANASIGARILLMRYIYVRNMLEKKWKESVFLPVAIEHDFFEITEAELSHNIRTPYKNRKPIIPEFDWRRKENLLDDTNFKGMLMQLADKGIIARKSLLEGFDYDPEEMKEAIREEEGTVLDPLYQDYRKDVISQAEKAGAEGFSLKESDLKDEDIFIPQEFGKAGLAQRNEIDVITRGNLKRKAKASALKLISRIKGEKANRKEKNKK